MDDQTAINKRELWEIIMRLAEPTDLLRSILNDAPPSADRLQSLFLKECSVTINQHFFIVPAAPGPSPTPPSPTA